MKQEYMSFNLNSYVKVKITDKGYQHLAEHYNKHLDDCPEYKKTAQHFKNQADSDGYLKMQGHHFVYHFGDVTSFMAHEYYDITIKTLTKKTKPQQTKKGSIAEVATNILIGYVVSFTANLLILPQFGFNVTIDQNIKIGLLFTVVSIIRSYCVRRLFNKFNFFGRGK